MYRVSRWVQVFLGGSRTVLEGLKDSEGPGGNWRVRKGPGESWRVWRSERVWMCLGGSRSVWEGPEEFRRVQ